MRGSDVPQKALDNTIHTFRELHAEFDDFLRKRTKHPVLVIGPPGVGKSWYVKHQMTPGTGNIIGGNITPVMAYCKLYDSLRISENRLVVLDDAERLWRDKNGRLLMRQLTDSNSPKLLTWETMNSELKRRGVEKSFTTTCNTLVICNHTRFGNYDETEALVDRCHCFYFDPTNEEVLRAAVPWFWHQEVFNYAFRNRHLLEKVSFRDLEQAADAQVRGRQWKQRFKFLKDGKLICQQVCNDPGFHTYKERVAEFERRTMEQLALEKGMSEATFKRYMKELKEKDQIEPPNLTPSQRMRRAAKWKLSIKLKRTLQDKQNLESEPAAKTEPAHDIPTNYEPLIKWTFEHHGRLVVDSLEKWEIVFLTGKRTDIKGDIIGAVLVASIVRDFLKQHPESDPKAAADATIQLLDGRKVPNGFENARDLQTVADSMSLKQRAFEVINEVCDNWTEEDNTPLDGYE